MTTYSEWNIASKYIAVRLIRICGWKKIAIFRSIVLWITSAGFWKIFFILSPTSWWVFKQTSTDKDDTAQLCKKYLWDVSSMEVILRNIFKRLTILHEMIHFKSHTLDYCVSQALLKLISYVNCFKPARQIDIVIVALDQMLQSDWFSGSSQSSCHCGKRLKSNFGSDFR